MSNTNPQKEYVAIIWKKDQIQTGERVSVFAADLEEAKKLLETEYGEGTVFDLHNEEEANRIR